MSISTDEAKKTAKDQWAKDRKREKRKSAKRKKRTLAKTHPKDIIRLADGHLYTGGIKLKNGKVVSGKEHHDYRTRKEKRGDATLEDILIPLSAFIFIRCGFRRSRTRSQGDR